MKKRTILRAGALMLLSIVAAMAIPAFADDQTTVDPASQQPGDDAANYSDQNSQPSAPSASSDTTENNADANSGITPDIATGDDDY